MKALSQSVERFFAREETEIAEFQTSRESNPEKAQNLWPLSASGKDQSLPLLCSGWDYLLRTSFLSETNSCERGKKDYSLM